MIKKISIGDSVPPFSFECTDPQIHSFNDLLGKNIVLYFYVIADFNALVKSFDNEAKPPKPAWVAEQLERLGAVVVSADRWAHEVLKSEDVKQAIRQRCRCRRA